MRLFLAISAFAAGGCGSTTVAPPTGPKPVDRSPERIIHLFSTINDNPNPNHSQITPSVDELILIGEPALAPAVELMLSEDEDTRLHAQSVLEGVTGRELGFVRGRGMPSEEADLKWRRLWKELGSIRYDMPADHRAAAVQLWRKWLADRRRQ